MPNAPASTVSRVFLVGLMGAGKSTVGKVLASRLGKEFIDSDQEIERRTGVKIAVIFDIEGEAGFRAREAETIEQLSQREDIVLATGGGAVENEGTREILKARGLTIYLSANPADLWERVKRDRTRPMLKTANPRQRLEELWARRDPLYREVAQLTMTTGAPSVQKLADALVEELIARGRTSQDFSLSQSSAASEVKADAKP